MSSTRCRPVPAALLAMVAFVLPGVAQAAYFPAGVVDGPSPDIQRLGGLDLALDGTGALVYIKNVGGIGHVFASRLAGGVWQPPEQIDAGLGAGASQPVVAAGSGGRIAVVLISGGQVFAVVRAAGAQSWPAPVALAPAGSDPSVSMSVHGAAYATWTGPGATSAANVYAAQMPRTANAFSPIGQPLDVDPNQLAGDGPRRSRVVAAADGSGIAVWGEGGAGGRSHVYLRRILGPTLSGYPQDATLDQEPGTGAAGGSADSPDIAVRSDSSFAWLVFREDFTDGSHIITRPLVGSLLDPGQVLVGAENATTPRIVVNSNGDGLATASGSDDFAALGNVMHDMAWLPLQRLDTPPAGVLPTPVATFPDGGFPTVSWMQDPVPSDGLASVHSRQWEVVASKRNVPAPDRDTLVSNPALGVVDTDLGFDASGDRIGDVAIGFVQGDPTARSIVVAGFDRSPGSFVLNTNQKFKDTPRPPLSWAAALDLWGPITYTVMVGGVPIGTIQTTKFAPTTPINDGVYSWKVVASDLRGQKLTSHSSRLLRIDTTPPVATISLAGKKKKGKPIKVTVRAHDLPQVLPTPPTPGTPTLPGTPTTPTPPVAPVVATPKGTPAASGVATVQVDFGDGSLPVDGVGTLVRATHVYRHSGFHTVSVIATDKAGSTGTITRRIHIGK